VPALFDRIGAGVTAARQRSPLLDHAVRTVVHYTEVSGTMQAGAVTYFAFLSFFPLLALAFFAVGYVGRVYPQARDNLTAALQQVLPGIIGSGPGELSLASIQDAAGTLGVIGLVGVLYAGLGWLSSMRGALQAVFEVPGRGITGFLLGKLSDVVTMVVIGVFLVLSVAVSGVVTGFSRDVLDWLGLSHDLDGLLKVVAVGLGLVANSVLFFAMFRLLARPQTPDHSLWRGAVVGALGFELLKQASRLLLERTAQQPAFQAFGISLILLVWINYFSRVVLIAASWAFTTELARTRRDLHEQATGIHPPDLEAH
jgi:membrane protein